MDYYYYYPEAPSHQCSSPRRRRRWGVKGINVYSYTWTRVSLSAAGRPAELPGTESCFQSAPGRGGNRILTRETAPRGRRPRTHATAESRQVGETIGWTCIGKIWGRSTTILVLPLLTDSGTEHVYMRLRNRKNTHTHTPAQKAVRQEQQSTNPPAHVSRSSVVSSKTEGSHCCSMVQYRGV